MHSFWALLLRLGLSLRVMPDLLTRLRKSAFEASEYVCCVQTAASYIIIAQRCSGAIASYVIFGFEIVPNHSGLRESSRIV